MLARIRTIEAPIRLYWGGDKAIPTKCLQWRGTWSQFLEDMRALRAGPLWKRTNNSGGKWAGFTDSGSTPERLMETGRSPETQRAFDAAMAHLHAQGGRDRLQYVPASGTWSIPRVLSGHPLAAMRRPRTALPVVNADLGACFSAFVKADSVAATMAVLARSVWNHIQSGGAATLRISYVLGFHAKHAETGAKGIIISIDVPLTNPASVAAALSVQTFRGLAIRMAQCYSGEAQDSLQNWQWAKPGLISMQGDTEEDLKRLRAGKIITPEDAIPPSGRLPGN